MNVCRHSNAVEKFRVPIDVKTNLPTRHGSVLNCPDCGLGFVKELPKPSEVEAHYRLPSYYTHGTSHLPMIEPRLRDRVITHLAWRLDNGRHFDPRRVIPYPEEGMTGLDIGCGSGAMLSAMSAAGLQPIGVDPDPSARLEAQRSGHTVFAGTAEALPSEIAGRTFDLVTLTHTLEHCLDPIKALSNARSALSTSGIFYCEVPNAGSRYFEIYGQISEMLDVPRHLYFFSKSALSAAARAAGLDITDWLFSGYTRHFLPSWKAWENSIFERLEASGVKLACSRRTLAGDLALLTRSAFLPPERRYDCIGFIARRAADA